MAARRGCRSIFAFPERQYWFQYLRVPRAAVFAFPERQYFPLSERQSSFQHLRVPPRFFELRQQFDESALQNEAVRRDDAVQAGSEGAPCLPKLEELLLLIEKS